MLVLELSRTLDSALPKPLPDAPYALPQYTSFRPTTIRCMPPLSLISRPIANSLTFIRPVSWMMIFTL